MKKGEILTGRRIQQVYDMVMAAVLARMKPPEQGTLGRDRYLLGLRVLAEDHLEAMNGGVMPNWYGTEERAEMLEYCEGQLAEMEEEAERAKANA